MRVRYRAVLGLVLALVGGWLIVTGPLFFTLHTAGAWGVLAVGVALWQPARAVVDRG